jgi:hypothetical protein
VCARDSHGRIARSPEAREQLMRETGYPHGRPGDRDRPIVAVGWNVERFDGLNLALRLAALGYTQVHRYHGSREAWR